MPETISLSVVNLSEQHLRDPDNRRRETQKLLESFSTVGFCQITGIEGYSVEELFEWAKWFFLEVPEEVKLEQLATSAFNPRNKNVYRGYFPLVDGALSHKQGYDLGPILDDGLIQEGNPFMQQTPRLQLPGREKEVETFYEASSSSKEASSKGNYDQAT